MSDKLKDAARAIVGATLEHRGGGVVVPYHLLNMLSNALAAEDTESPPAGQEMCHMNACPGYGQSGECSHAPSPPSEIPPAGQPWDGDVTPTAQAAAYAICSEPPLDAEYEATWRTLMPFLIEFAEKVRTAPPTHTDLMVPPETLDEYLNAQPAPTCPCEGDYCTNPTCDWEEADDAD